MKYLHDDRLAEITTCLTDCPVGGSISQRILHGRLEAYTMKRGTGDKKYAFKLGEKFVASLENMVEDVIMAQDVTRKRSQSAGIFEEVDMPLSKLGRRHRSCSFDMTRSKVRKEDFSLSEMPTNRTIIPSALGDFAEQGTRRLMTDLILTLNMSFPDFDFGEVQPTDFVCMSVRTAMDRINKRLSNVALRRESFLTDLWSALDGVIHLSGCDVYSYQPPASDDADPMAFLTQTLTEDSVFYGGDEDDANPGEKTTDSDSQPTVTAIWSFNYFFVNKTIKRIVLFTCMESMRNHEPEEIIEEEFANLPPVADSADLDFDLDPEAATAGGIPISIA